MVGEGRPLLPEIFGQPAPLERNRRFWTDTRFPMSLRWSSYVGKPPKGRGEKRKTAVFLLKSQLVWRKSAAKFLCLKTVSDKVVRCLGLTIRAEMIGGATPSTWNFESKWLRWSEIADFRSIFARSASAVSPNEQSSKRLIWSPLRAFQWA